MMTFHKGLIIDGYKGSICRFVNHSCDPNCIVEKWTVDGQPRMALFAGQNMIDVGEEITYDYNFA
jgi:histone-lysine N-methyltransferase ASH1L